jgi:hypothetical protein
VKNLLFLFLKFTNMENIKSKATELTESITDYLETSYKLAVIEAADKSTKMLASVTAFCIVLLLGLFVILFAGVALGIWLGNLVNNAALGFVLVAALFLLIILLLIAMRKRIVFPVIRNTLINMLYEENDQNVQ